MFGGVSHLACASVEMSRANSGRGFAWGVSNHGEILTRKFFGHLCEHGPHEGWDGVYLDISGEDQAQFIVFVQDRFLNRLVLRVGLADPIEKFRLPLPLARTRAVGLVRNGVAPALLRGGTAWAAARCQKAGTAQKTAQSCQGCL